MHGPKTKKNYENCQIKYPVKNYIDMIDKIDALIIARDDMHYEILKPFVEKIPVFIDKPLNKRNRIEFLKNTCIKDY